MLFRDTIQEYEFDCCSRKMAPRAVGGYIKMLGYPRSLSINRPTYIV